MADRTQRLAIVVTAQDLAAGKLKNVRSELAQMGTAGKLASVGLGGAMLVANKAGQAFGNLKSRLTSLAGPLGLIGLSAGVFSITGAFEKGISKATEWGLAIEKLTGLTSNNAEQLSGLLGITEKYGISNERITTIAGFTEKALGKYEVAAAKAAKGGTDLVKSQDAVTKAHERLRVAQLALSEVERRRHSTASARLAAQNRVTDATRTLSEAEQKLAAAHSSSAVAAGTNVVSLTKLQDLQKQYGVQLADSKGKALDFQSVLLNVADAYSKARSAADKAKMATLSATLFGRGYADLIPILKLGRKGILDAEQAAKDLGLTLTSQNVADLAKYREAMREASDATSGLELQLGLLVMPDLTTAFKTFVAFMRVHQEDAKVFFRNAIGVAEGFVNFVTGTAIPTIQGLVSAAAGAWNLVPAPLRDLLVKGFVADRTIKFLFGMSPIHFVASMAEGAIAKGLGGVLGGFAARGSSPANPVFVSGGGIGGVLPGVGALGGAAGVAGLTTILALAAIPAALAIWGGLSGPQSTFNEKGVQTGGMALRPGGTLGINVAALGPKGGGGGPAIDRAHPFGAGKAADDLALARMAVSGARVRSDFAWLAPLQTSATALTTVASTMTALQIQLRADFHDAIAALRKATDPAAILAAAARVTKDVLGGVGSGKTTQATIADLTAKRDALLAAGDKTNAAVLTAEIRKISPLVAGREHQRQLLAQGAKVAASSESAKQKVAELKGIESTLLSEHRTTAAATIQGLIDIVNAVKGISIPAGNPNAYPPSGHLTPKPSGPVLLPGDSPGGHAAGLFGMTRGRTELGYAGEAGGEAVAIVRNPKLINAMSGNATQFVAPDGSPWPSKAAYQRWRTGLVPTIGNFGRGPMPFDTGGLAAAIVAAIRQGMAGSRVTVAARSITRTQTIDTRYANRSPISID